LRALQFGFEASTSELRLRLDRAESELDVETKKCLMLRKELLRDMANKAAGDDDNNVSVYIQLTQLQVMFAAL